MARRINLRQIEAFKAVVDLGTVSRGAEALNISQPAMSRLIAHLELDSGLKLFDRLKGRLAPTAQAKRLYNEIERVFAGVRQIENAVDAIRRQEQGRLTIGVLPALSGHYIERATTAFLSSNPDIFCSLYSLSSQWTAERLIGGQLDVGIVGTFVASPHLMSEPLAEYPLVCIMPIGHPLSMKAYVEPGDLQQLPFVGFSLESLTGHRVARMLETYRIQPRMVVTASVASTVCEFVGAGHGVSLIHPLMLSGMKGRFAVRRFEPEILDDFRVCRREGDRNMPLITAFADEARLVAEQICRPILSGAWD